jgi:signal transduction histidine kinase
MYRSFSARLALLYTGAFALAVVLMGVVTLFATRAALSEQFDGRIRAEASALSQEYRTEGLEGLRQAVNERDRTPGAVDYGLQAPGGASLGGKLGLARTAPGWTVIILAQPDGDRERTRVLTSDLPGGYRLLVGDDANRVEALDAVLLKSFGWTLGGVLLLGAFSGYALSRDVGRRLAAISGTAEAIIDGDLARRVPVGGSGDDLDRLASTFNRMLDRINALMDSLKQVSTDVAHDLRTPLTRLRQRLESERAKAGAEQGVALDAALDELDGILATFAALLRIAQIEGGARRAAFQQIDLADVARTVVEAFIPSAEDEGHTLAFEAGAGAVVQGDRELLTQMLVNLVENGLRHAGPGAKVRVIVAADAGVVLRVVDDGPGVPEAERDKLFDRFYRLEQSRSTPGNGLGLALVAAVARLHRAGVALADAGPGLDVRVSFPR